MLFMYEQHRERMAIEQNGPHIKIFKKYLKESGISYYILQALTFMIVFCRQKTVLPACKQDKGDEKFLKNTITQGNTICV